MSGEWKCRELGAGELSGVRTAVAGVEMSRILHLREALADPAGHGRWWYAAIGGGGVGAFAAVQGTRAHLYGDDTSAVEAMAQAMLRSQQLHTSRDTHRHVLFGPAAVIDPFWSIFQAVGRQVVADRRWGLMTADSEGKGSRRLQLDIADGGDLSVCVAFLGEHAAEMHGKDPRKVAPEAFEREVEEAIDEGRVLLGREGGRAMFVAQLADLDDDTVMVQRMHVPLPYRSRKVLVGGALFGARTLGPAADKKLWMLAEGEAMQVAAARAGFSELGQWREVAMLG